MLDLETEVVRHIFFTGYMGIRKTNITPDLFDLDQNLDEERNKKLLRTQSLVSWLNGYYDEFRKTPTAEVITSEFTWTLDDEYQEQPETEIEYLAEKLKVRYAKTVQRRSVMELAQADPEEFSNLYIKGSRKVYDVMSSNDFAVQGEDVFGIIEHQRKRVLENKNLGVSLGFLEISSWTGGVRPGHLAVLAALPKRMKTWVLIKAWLSQSLAGEAPVFATLELSKEETVGRVLCLMSGVPYNSFYRGQLLPYQWKDIEEAGREFAKFKGAIIEPPLGNRFVSSLLYEAERYDASSIIIDQFSFLQWSAPHNKENEGYKEIVYDLKNSALIYDLPIYMAAQLNRLSVEDDEFPIAQHLGLTRSLEEASDLIMGIKSNDALKEEHQIMLGVVEARHCESGPKARWTIQYDFFNTTRFDLHEV
jgi:replicative DNA helicase